MTKLNIPKMTNFCFFTIWTSVYNIHFTTPQIYQRGAVERDIVFVNINFNALPIN